ncbi:TMhelix containing protein [Vibrio phage 1.067.O._10N.261.52.C9]|nr:TMhelix containing protein [Vibrio phage 1.067.O._10N.261.52.C9]
MATIFVLISWVLFIFWAAWFASNCVDGVYKGCESSSGFAESFGVLGMGGSILFVVAFMLAIIYDSNRVKDLEDE